MIDCMKGTLSCDEFMAFWQDKKLRTQIYRETWLSAKCREDAEDLRQEAWAEICMSPVGATFTMAERAAHRAIA